MVRDPQVDAALQPGAERRIPFGEQKETPEWSLRGKRPHVPLWFTLSGKSQIVMRASIASKSGQTSSTSAYYLSYFTLQKNKKEAPRTELLFVVSGLIIF